MTLKEMLKILRKDGWETADIRGSHMQMKHPVKKGKVTVPGHSGDLHPKTIKSITKQAGLG